MGQGMLNGFAARYIHKEKNMRASNYNIYVDLPGNKDEMLLVHGYTGAYDKVSRRVATYIRSLETVRPPKPLYGDWSSEPLLDDEPISLSEASVNLLKKRGYLTEMLPEEEEKLFCKIANALHIQSSTPGYIFMPTYDCNLRCPYCFQDHMRTDASYSHLLRIMKSETIDRIFAAIPQIEAYHGLSENMEWKRNIGFFGGEPLLQRNLSVIENIIKKAKTLWNVGIWAITNGTEIDHYKHLLDPEAISQLQITLDGPRNEHDKRRVYEDRRGSFEKIASNITMALNLGVVVSVRMNIDRNNICLLPELANEIINRGWNTYTNFSAYTAPVHAANKHTDIKTTLSSWELDCKLTDMRKEHPQMKVVNRPDDRAKDQAQLLFNQRKEPSLRSTFCGAHSGMYVFDPFGDIYACWERTGNSNIRIGAIDQNGNFKLDEELNNMWRSRNVTTNKICLRCRYALHCGGGCAVLAESQRGGFFINHCDGYAARFRASVAEAYIDFVNGIDTINKVDRACDM